MPFKVIIYSNDVFYFSNSNVFFNLKYIDNSISLYKSFKRNLPNSPYTAELGVCFLTPSINLGNLMWSLSTSL